MNKSPRPPVAIVGVDVLFPGRPGPRGFWRDIVAGRDAIRTVPPTHWLIEDYYDADPTAPDKTYSNKGAFIDPVSFDPMEFGIPPSSLAAIDTAQLLALVVARNVLAEVDGKAAKPMDRSRVSVILGVASATEMVDLMCGRMQRPAWVGALREAGLPEDRVQHIADRIADRFPEWQENTFPGLLGNIVAGRIANRFNLGGSNFVTDAACASSLASVQAGLDELYLGRSRMVLVGGADALNDILMYMCFSKTPAFSRSGDIRPFSDKADGTLIGEGIGIFAIKLLADAERDGDHIYAVLRGVGRSSDGRATSVYAPRPDGQASAIRRAYDEAGYACDTVELIENHGTGTIAGDAAEIAGLTRVFGDKPARSYGPHVAIGSVKSQIGHTKAAAGSAGLFKAVMALHNKVLPPTIKVERPNPKLNLDQSPFYINTAPRPWIRGSSHPRRAAVSSFGFGGSNFHVTVEEYTGPGAQPARIWANENVLVLLSAPSDASLREKMASVRASLATVADLPGFAAQLAADFRADAANRAAIVARGVSDLDLKLGKLIAGEKSIVGAYLGEGAPFQDKIAFLFPGQGSQYVGMGGDLAMTFDEARQAWDKAADLDPFAQTPLHVLAFPPPCFDAATRTLQSERLTRMENAQPAIAAMSQSLLAVLDRLGLKPDMVAGHSFGEVMALHAAGVLTDEDALVVARKRGLAMLEAAAETEGGMIAVPLAREAVNALLAEWNLPDVVVANDNAPTQVVLSGPSAAIMEVARRLKARDIAAINLPVASAFHSSVVAGATKRFARDLADVDVASPALPVFANASALPYDKSASAIRRAMAEQIAKPVRFREMIDALHQAGARLFVEVGPSAVLTGLVAQCLRDRPHIAVALDRKNADGIETFLSAVAQFAALGLPLAYDRLQHSVAPEKIIAPTPPKQAVSLLGTNYNKPYPPANGAAGRPAPNPPRPEPAHSSSPEAFQYPMSSSPKSPPPPPEPVQHDAVASFYQQLAQTHAAFQQSMAESHQAFLNVAAQALWTLSGTTASLPGLPVAPVMPPPQVMPAPVAQTMAPPPAMPVARVAPTPPPVPRPAVAAPAAAPARDLTQEVLAVVAEKTGYPADMLKLDMDLEAELGIDSIKQVEILSTIRERRPELPEIDSAQLSQLRTLNAIIATIRGSAPAPSAPVAQPAVSAAPPARRSFDVKDILLGIVADKTGYPKDMLDLDHDLEAELGIDSIKQVEILSAMREAVPSIPEIDSSRLSELRNLRAILSVLEPANPNQPAPHEATAQAGRAEGAKTEDEGRAVPRHETVLRAVPAGGFVLPGLEPGAAIDVASLSENSAVADELTAALRAAGFSATRARTPEDVSDRLILLDVGTPSGPGSAVDTARRAIAWARAFANRKPARGFFVTVQATGGTFGLMNDPGQAAWGSGLAALARTAQREWPAVTVKALDIGASGPDTAARILRELCSGSPDPVVALPDPERRLVPAIVPAALDASAGGKLRDGMVLIVSGGARGVTAAVLRRLASRYRLKIAMLGRTALVEETRETAGAADEAAIKRALIEAARARGETPSPRDIGRKASELLAQREIRATLRDLEALNATAAYHAVDIAKRDAVAATVARARAAWGPITGVIHAAGVLRDKAIAEKTDAMVEAVAGTKVDGLDALLNATSGDPLEFLCLFSSAAAAYGNAGQADYAMANEILNKVAQAEAHRRPNCVVKSIGWGPWDGGMVDASLKALFAARNIRLIGLEDGADFLIRELDSGSPAVEVLAGAPMTGQEVDLSAEIVVGPATHPFLQDHVIDGHAVLPMVAVIDWFHRFAASLDTVSPVATLQNFRVLKGLIFDDLENAHRLALRGRLRSGTGEIELLDATGSVRYAATVTYGAQPRAPMLQTVDIERQAWPWTVPSVYGAALFHGPAFQSIEALATLRANGGEAQLRAVSSGTRWQGGSWRTNPTLLDGALQLAQLWALQATGELFLPTRIEHIDIGATADMGEAVECRLQSRSVGGAKTVNDVDLMRADGSVLARLRGVEMYRTQLRVPSSAPIVAAAQ